MGLMCLPLIVIASVLVVMGLASPIVLAVAVAVGCTVVMALMMRGMHGH